MLHYSGTSKRSGFLFKPHHATFILLVTGLISSSLVFIIPSAIAGTITVTPSVIGPGETAIVRVENQLAPDPHNAPPEFLTQFGQLGPTVYLGDGIYEATLTYDGPGSTLVVFKPRSWMQIPSVAVVHFRGSPAASGISLVASRENSTVTSINGTWMTIVDDGMSISGLDSTVTLEEVQVKISDGYHPHQDRLGLLIDGDFVQTLSQSGITVSYAHGTLTMQGEATIAQYEKLLRKVAYRNTAPYPNTTERQIDFVLTGLTGVDPTWGEVDLDHFAYDPVTGHYYEYVHDPSTWVSANRKASQRTLMGMQGYLATITSQRENDIVQSIAKVRAWIGASAFEDNCDDGNPCGFFRWVTGPEAGTIISKWKHPYEGSYTNWADWTNHDKQDRFHVHINPQSGKWVNDTAALTRRELGYIVEYGGFPGDGGPVTLTASVAIKFPAIPPAPGLDPSKSWLTVSPDVVQANGVDSSIIRVTLKDEKGHPYTEFAPTITVRNAVVGPIVHEGGGDYSATVTSTIPGTSQVVVKVDGEEVLRDGLITFRNTQIQDDRPFVKVSQPATTYQSQDAWIVIDPGLEIGGMNPTSILLGASVQIKDGQDPVGDELGFVVNGQWQTVYGLNGISASYDANSGVLNLTGNAPWTAYLTALRSVAFRNNSASGPGESLSREIVFSISKDTPNRMIIHDPATGHAYEFILAPKITWSDAEKAAAGRSLYGQQGYLATINSQEENDLIESIALTSSWIGGSDYEQHETWRWMTGPETGQAFWQGMADGSPVQGRYANWSVDEPNHYDTDWGIEHYVEIFGQDAYSKLEGLAAGAIGKWNDLSHYHDRWVDGYIVEYGGLPGDPKNLRFSDSIIINILENRSPTADFTWTPGNPLAGEPVQFENGSSDPDLDALTFSWDFGDGNVSADKDPVHVFNVPGTYVITLTATDPGGLSDSVTKSITVTSQGLVVSGTVFHDDGGASGTPNDGAQNGGEIGLAGHRVRAFRSNHELLATALTDAQGGYTLAIHEVDPSDDIVIRLVSASGNWIPTGYTPGAHADPVTLSAFQTSVDMPLVIQPGLYEYAGFNVGMVPPMAVLGHAMGAASRGGMVTYPFTVKVGTAGELDFAITTPRGWEYAVYDQDGSRISEPIIVAGPEAITYNLVVRVPSWEQTGAVDTARIDVRFTFAGNPLLIESADFMAVTTVQSGRMDLVVAVRNVTANIPPGENAYSTGQVEAEQGDVLEYQVTAKNTGFMLINNVVIWAPIPQGMQLIENAYGNGQYVKWIKGGDAVTGITRLGSSLEVKLAQLIPNDEGVLAYRVSLQ